MATSYPGAVDAFTNPTSTDSLNSATVPHATQHANANDAIEAIEGELGVNPSGASATVVARFDAIEAAGWVTSTRILDGTIVNADINAAAAIDPAKVSGTAVVTADARLSDARTPTAHAASHASAGSDPITVAESQVTGLTSALAGKAALAAEAVGIGKEFASHPWQANSFTTNVAQNELRLWPSWCPQAGTYSEVRIRVGSTPAPASTTWRLGVYADSNGQPGSLIADLGTIDPTTAGIKAVTGLTLVLPYGRIWVGFAMQGTASTGGTYFSGYPRESVNVSAFGVAYLHVSNTGVTGGLPSTFATGTGQSTGLPPSILFLRSA